MIISLVLTGRNRFNDLNRFFNSLLAQEFALENIQLIFVNQGEFNPRIEINGIEKLSFIEVTSGHVSLSVARNLGIKYATGDIIGFPDDDCWYPSKLLSSLAEHFLQHPSDAALCTNVFDPYKIASYGGRPLNMRCLVTFFNLFSLPISVGIFLRRQQFEAVGSFFDENLGAGTRLGSGEETELVYRLLKHGFIVKYSGYLQVFHPVPDYQPHDIDKYHSYGLGFGFLNGRIMRDGFGFYVLPYFSNIIFRSLAGFGFNLFSPRLRKLYLNRFIGVCSGFFEGLRGKNVSS
jgi:glycosyltransferase involved in cell wall biosynthesis